MELVKKRKGLFYTIDALLAISILFVFMLVAVPLVKVNVQKSDLQYDILNSFSSMKVSELDSGYFPGGLIIENEDKNKSVLEFMGELYIKDPASANTFAQNILSPLNLRENVGLYFDGALIYSEADVDYSDAKNVDVARQYISGISGTSTQQTGFSVRAFLVKSMRSKYYYFGGYIGDGNISLLVNYSGVIDSAEIELSASDGFDLYIDGVLIGSYEGSVDKTIPMTYTLPPSALAELDSNEANIIEFKNKSTNLGISGGFIRINYLSDVEPETTYRYYFPGVEGITNIYDSVYLPSINDLNVNLHYKSSKQILLKLGNVTLYSGSSNAESTEAFNVPNTNGLYSAISQKNVPLRLALREFTDSSGSIVQVVLVTDLSGSMKKSVSDIESLGSSAPQCDDESKLFDDDVRKGDLARCLDLDFASQILGVDEDHFLWPVRFGVKQGSGDGTVNSLNDPHDLDAINTEINSYVSGEPKGQTCLACAINEGYKLMSENSEEGVDYVRFIILMTDGLPTHVPQDWNSATQTSTSSVYGAASCNEGYCDTSGNCNSNYQQFCSLSLSHCNEAVNSTVAAAKRAYNNLNATVFTIAFGDVENCAKANYSLGAVAAAGNGTYYHSSNPEDLADIYDEIADKIFTLIYEEQIAKLAGSGSFSNRIFPDSYIEFSYNAPSPIPGLKFPVQKGFDTESSVNLTLFPGDKIVDAKIISYSGSKWTSNVSLRNSTNNNLFFNLRDYGYGEGFNALGDPFNVYLPIDKISQGENNIKIGLHPYSDIVEGSLNNKVIYTVLRNISSYSGVKLVADGCIWKIPTENNGIISINVPSDYSGSIECEYEGQTTSINNNDAYQYAALYLLDQLDLDDDGKIDINLDEEFFNISSTEIEDIPINWKTLVEVRTWS